MTRLVLGSASPGRRSVLRQAGIDPLVVVSDVDEDAVIADLGAHRAPDEITCALAAAKAEHVAGALDPAVARDAVVIGCDSMLFHDGELRGKPATEQAAREMWRRMRGTTGHLHTGHCLLRVRDNRVVHRAVAATVTAVRFGTPSDDEIDAYVTSGEPLRVAGGFTLDGLGGWFVDGVDGDPSAVIGIGLPAIRGLLHAAGLSVPALWAANPVSGKAAARGQ